MCSLSPKYFAENGLQSLAFDREVFGGEGDGQRQSSLTGSCKFIYAAVPQRRLDEQASIVVLERGTHASFAHCGLPYYIGGEITRRVKLLVAGDTQLHGWLNLDVHLHLADGVAELEPAGQQVVVRFNPRRPAGGFGFCWPGVRPTHGSPARPAWN